MPVERACSRRSSQPLFAVGFKKIQILKPGQCAGRTAEDFRHAPVPVYNFPVFNNGQAFLNGFCHFGKTFLAGAQGCLGLPAQADIADYGAEEDAVVCLPAEDRKFNGKLRAVFAHGP